MDRFVRGVNQFLIICSANQQFMCQQVSLWGYLIKSHVPSSPVLAEVQLTFPNCYCHHPLLYQAHLCAKQGHISPQYRGPPRHGLPRLIISTPTHLCVTQHHSPFPLSSNKQGHCPCVDTILYTNCSFCEKAFFSCLLAPQDP